MEQYGLLEEQGSDYFYGYDMSCDATISNAFAAAAYRFGHSLVYGRMKVLEPGNVGTHILKDNFFNPSFLYEDPDNVEGMLVGASQQRGLLSDR